MGVWQFCEYFACALSKYKPPNATAVYYKKIFPYTGEDPVSNDSFYCLSSNIKYMFICTLVLGMQVCLHRCIRVSETK